MRKLRKLLGVILIVSSLLVVQLPPSGAAAVTVPEFSISSGGVLLSYNGTSSDVVIPSTVIEIATDAFRDNDKIRKVTIPNSVRKINEYAFWDCDNLQEVVIGSGLKTIDDFVFANCMGLVSINIPKNIKSIGIYAFEDDVNLESAVITEFTHDIHDTAFDGCYKLVIFAPEGSYPWEYAQGFYNRQKTFPIYEDTGAIDVPDENEGDTDNTGDNDNTGDSDSAGETEVIDNTNPYGEPGAYTTEFEITQRPDGTYTAVAYNQNTDVYSETHVVGNSAVFFMDNSSLSVKYGSDYSAGNSSDTENVNESEPENKVIYSSSIPKYTIVDNRIVADKAYYLSRDMENMSLPEGTKEIGQFAFSRTDVVSVTLPEGVEKIDYGAFYHCDLLENVKLPESVIKIEPYVFEETKWVKDFKSGIPGLDNGLDDGFNAENGEFLVSGGALIAYRGRGKNVTIPSEVRIIAAGCFKDHTEIESVAFPDTLLSIGEEAFCGCSELSTVYFGGNENEILDRAFKDTKVSVKDKPDSIVNVGIDSFNDLDSASGINVTYEETAQRLSNVSLRSSAPDPENAGVTVNGLEGAVAYLDGADRAFDLKILSITDSVTLDRALDRASGFLDGYSLGERALYDITLTDSSGIPITKLGNQGLEIAVQVPENLEGKKLTCLTYDRNGQLEDIPVTVVNSSEGTFARFVTYHLSVFALYSTCEDLADSDILTSEVTLKAASGGPATPSQTADPADIFKSPTFMIKLFIALLMVITGLFLIFVRKRA